MRGVCWKSHDYKENATEYDATKRKNSAEVMIENGHGTSKIHHNSSNDANDIGYKAQTIQVMPNKDGKSLGLVPYDRKQSFRVHFHGAQRSYSSNSSLSSKSARTDSTYMSTPRNKVGPKRISFPGSKSSSVSQTPNDNLGDDVVSPRNIHLDKLKLQIIHGDELGVIDL